VPAGIAAVLHVVRILLNFGRHLAGTTERRAARPGFGAIAVCFGSGRVFKILAHLQRGILRAMALERVLLARAARGQDIRFTEPRAQTSAPPAAPAAPPAEPPQEARAQPERHAESKSAAQPSRPRGGNDPELFMPTLEELEAQVRRRPLGRTIVEICLDLAVVPGFCTGAFWNTLFDSIRLYGGSVSELMQERMRREVAYIKEQDRVPRSDWSWQELTREGKRLVLGFNIGDAVVDPFGLADAPEVAVASAATG
jgi:hypothetical protein